MDGQSAPESRLRPHTGFAGAAGLTIAEYLPFEAQRLHKMFAAISLFTEQ